MVSLTPRLLTKRSSFGVEARITVYGLIGDKGPVKIF